MALLNVGTIIMLLEKLKKYKAIIILSILLFVGLVVVYALNKKTDDEVFVETPQKTQTDNSTNNGESSDNTSDDKSTDTITQESVDKKLINGLFESNHNAYKNSGVKDYTILKESGVFRLGEVTIHNSQTNISYINYVIFRNNIVISGINNDYPSDFLREQGVPEDIIEIYVKRLSDV